MAQSDISQAAANKNTNKEALRAQGDDSDASDASHTTAQLLERAAITIQRRLPFGRTGRATPSKAAALVKTAREQSAATGTRLTTDNTLLEPLPIHHTDGGSRDGSLSGLSDTDGPSYYSLPADFRLRRKRRTAPTDTDATDNNNNDNDNDGDDNAGHKADAQPTGADGGPSAIQNTNKDGGPPLPSNPDEADDPLDATSMRQHKDDLARMARANAEMKAYKRWSRRLRAFVS